MSAAPRAAPPRAQRGA